VNAFGLAAAGKDEVLLFVKGGHGREDGVLIAKVEEIGVAHLVLRDAELEVVAPEVGEACGIFERQRTKEHGVDDRKDGSVGADADSQGEDGDGGKAGGFSEHADAVAKVLSEVLNPSHVACIATFFFAFFNSADFKESLPTRLFDGEAFADVLLRS
jgi:hypothetical protein